MSMALTKKELPLLQLLRACAEPANMKHGHQIQIDAQQCSRFVTTITVLQLARPVQTPNGASSMARAICDCGTRLHKQACTQMLQHERLYLQLDLHILNRMAMLPAETAAYSRV